MWKVTEGNKVRGVKVGETGRIFQAGEVLPADYNPDITYIQQRIVEEVKETRGGKK